MQYNIKFIKQTYHYNKLKFFIKIYIFKRINLSNESLMSDKTEKIIIIGAGLAGLYSAVLLKESGYEVTLLEARERPGGRTFTLSGVDLGGSWISSLQPRIMKLCYKYNLEICKQVERGKIIRYFNEQREELLEKPNIQKNMPNIFTTYIQQFDQQINSKDFFSENLHLDQISFYDWCMENIADPLVFKTFNYSFTSLTCTSPKAASMFFWLYFLKSCGGYHALTGVKNSAQEFYVRGGIGKLIDALAKGLNIVYDSKVTHIEKHEREYKITTKNNLIYYANKVISAIPLQLIPTIKWTPKLNQDRESFYRLLQMGYVTKVILQYEHKFWQHDGYSAHIVSDTAPVHLCYDVSNNKYNTLAVFIINNINYSNEQILEQLAFLLKNNLAKSPKYIYRKNWIEDEFSQGGYFCVPPIGSLTRNYKYLTKPEIGVHFIGTETATQWMGYMEGALESAERLLLELGNNLDN
ncbi:MAG: maoA [Burkholderiales bacterium]|jgi:monoamine oxidase|nr:maoA [Burkholderiales bacterium]